MGCNRAEPQRTRQGKNQQNSKTNSVIHKLWEGGVFVKKFVFILVVILMLVVGGCDRGNTDLPMSSIYEVSTTGAFQFAFHYEKEEPIFEFISPSGIIYKEDSENMAVERATQCGGMKSVYYLFEKGEIGEWKINYDKFTNESVDFYYAED